MDWELWLVVIAAALSVAALVIALLTYRHLSATRKPLPVRPAGPTVIAQAPASAGLAAFVVNPIKEGAAELRDVATALCAELNWREPLWLETTVEETGEAQAREALSAGADVVVACGGDGTVRSVATAMAGSGTPMGLIPLGTGNLLARNLDLPPNAKLADLTATALVGTNRLIDVGWVDVLRPESAAGNPHLFLVIAGLGFDAQMIADTDERLKKRIGWVAYFLGGVRHLHGQRMRVSIQIDQAPRFTKKVRTVMIGNCGKLPGGMTLIPDAFIDDGWLDLAAVDPRGGLIGWTVLAGEVAVQSTGKIPPATQVIDHLRGRTFVLQLDDPERLQVDGDIVGRAEAVLVRVDPGALVVRVAG